VQTPAPTPAAPERPAAPAEKRPSPQSLYDEGYALLKQGKPEQSRDRMLEFLRLYPEAGLAANAHFWIGESYYDQKQYEQAILEYDKVVQKFPKSEKVPSALLKQAFAFDAMSDPADARILLRKILREYPSSDQASIAKKKLEALGE
jgi:tol-pal system protein YbgF